MNLTNNQAYEYVADRVHYNKDSGVFTWLRREGNDKGTKMFNTRYAGRVSGGTDRQGYVRISVEIQGVQFYISAHRLAWFMTNGSFPNGDIDHISGDITDNRMINLRCVSKSINQRNKKMPSHNTSGFVGVSIDKKTGKWRATARANGKQNYLGVFDDVNDAARAAKSFRECNGYTARHGESK